MNMQYNTGVRCDIIQSDVTVSGQVYQYQVIAYAKYQVIACQLSGVRSQVITCQVSVSNIKCQVINMSASGKLNTESQHHMSGNHPAM